MTREIFKKAFLGRFFPREQQREAKVEEFINLHQGGMVVKEYSFKFIQLSKYTSSLVSNSRDEISHFVMGVSEGLEEDGRAAMIHEIMVLFRLMVHTQ